MDLGSKNGTLVNGTRVDRFSLQDGDSFQCGDVRFKLSSAPGAFEPTVRAGAEHALLAPLHGGAAGAGPSAWECLGAEGRPAREADVRSAEKLRVLLKVSQMLSSPGPIDGLLERVLNWCSRSSRWTGWPSCWWIRPRGRCGPRVARLSTGELPSGSFYSQHVVDYVRKRSVAALFADAREDPRLDGATSVMLQSIRSAMCVPLKPQDEVLGVLYVDNQAQANRFTEEDLEFLTAFANQAAIALENSMLTQRLAEEAVLRNAYLRFFPPTVIKKLQSDKRAHLDIVETEVTVLFSDISGFTSLSSTLNPRQVVDLLNDYFPAMADIVFRYEGTLEKYIGDALMAVWGAPFSQPEDADRALRAAVEMQRALADLNARWRAQGSPS